MSNRNDSEEPQSDLHNAARSLLNDIEAMAADSEFEFGEFNEWTTTEHGVVVAWPNLSISAARLRDALERNRR